MIQLHKVSVVLDDRPILRSIDFIWQKGEAIALIGENGAGKSTLLKVLATLIKPASGKMLLHEGMNMQQWRYAIGTVFPETFLYDSLSAAENLHFYRELYGIQDKDLVARILEQVNLLSVADELVRSFSKGMRQRLSIARALIHYPTYLLLDEPFDGLDLASQEVLQQLLLDLKKRGIGWVLVSHDIRQAWSNCDRAVMMDQGRIVLEEECRDQKFDLFLKAYRSLAKEQRYAFS